MKGQNHDKNAEIGLYLGKNAIIIGRARGPENKGQNIEIGLDHRDQGLSKGQDAALIRRIAEISRNQAQTAAQNRRDLKSGKGQEVQKGPQDHQNCPKDRQHGQNQNPGPDANAQNALNLTKKQTLTSNQIRIQTIHTLKNLHAPETAAAATPHQTLPSSGTTRA